MKDEAACMTNCLENSKCMAYTFEKVDEKAKESTCTNWMEKVTGDNKQKDHTCNIKIIGNRNKDEVCESEKLNGGCVTGLRCAHPHQDDEVKQKLLDKMGEVCVQIEDCDK